jgi:hypothetical protein
MLNKSIARVAAAVATLRHGRARDQPHPRSPADRVLPRAGVRRRPYEPQAILPPPDELP